MATIIDYISWRGDLTFEREPFNIVDNLVLSALAYVEMDLLFQGEPERNFTLKDLASEYTRMVEPVYIYSENSVFKEIPDFLRAVGDSERYRNVIVKNFVNHIDIGKILQFSALEFILPDGSNYVAYRGTDDTIVGWKEDFLLAVTEVEAEKEAVAYLNRIASHSMRPLRVGGHSKGAHLAIYAAMMCEKAVKDRILSVYSNDGPGFIRETTETAEAKEIEDRVVRIIPEDSLIGMLQEPIGHTFVVKSEQKRIMQHDIFSWCVMGNDIVQAETISKVADDAAKVIADWIEGFDPDKKEQFVNEFFSVLEAPGMETISEIEKGGMKSIQAMSRQLGEVSAETREKIRAILKDILFEVII